MSIVKRVFHLCMFIASAAVGARFCVVDCAQAQPTPFPRSGMAFTFAIPEGPDNQFAPGSQASSQLSLVIRSLEAGTGTITSPSGYSKQFTFKPDSATIISLDVKLMLINDLGKTKKGLLITSCKPINVVLHNYVTSAGEATHLIPDEALGTDYFIASWGLWDDVSEKNRTEFVVTAKEDGTNVTIVPTVRALPSLPAKAPINITLDRGECYIVKADTTSAPATTSLSESTVKSDKPVNVMYGTTCSYVPLMRQSCNPLLDVCLPVSLLDSVFYVQPTNVGAEDVLLITSPVRSFVAFVNGVTSFTTTGRITAQVLRPTKVITNAPVQVHILSQGSDAAPTALSDPTIMQVLPEQHWQDSVYWSIPIDYSGFQNTVGVISTASSFEQIELNGQPLTGFGLPTPIPNSTMAGLRIPIAPGSYRLTSPVPLGVTVAGFAPADGYSFTPGTLSRVDSLPREFGLVASDAFVCHEFDAVVFADSSEDESISTANFSIEFDPTTQRMLGLEFLQFFKPGQVTVDSSTPGKLRITIRGEPSLMLKDSIVRVRFVALKRSLAESMDLVTTISSCHRTVVYNKTASYDFPIDARPDTLYLDPAISIVSVTLGDTAIAAVRMEEDAAAMEIDRITLRLIYNHDVLTLSKNVEALALARNWRITILTIGDTDVVTMENSAGVLSGIGDLLKLRFASYVSDTSGIPVTLQASYRSKRYCPLDVLSRGVTTNFDGKLLCGDRLFASAMGKKEIRITSVNPNPARGRVSIGVENESESSSVSVILTGQSGIAIPLGDRPIMRGPNRLEFELPSEVASGTYFLSVSTIEFANGSTTGSMRASEIAPSIGSSAAGRSAQRAITIVR